MCPPHGVHADVAQALLPAAPTLLSAQGGAGAFACHGGRSIGLLRSGVAWTPADLPRFFINFLTDPDDLVLDIFSGSNTTGYVAEQTGRRWISVESDRRFAALFAVRFMTALDDGSIEAAVTDLENGRVIDLDAGLSLGSAGEGPRPFGTLQNQLFE
jgi:hypothetical protein